MADLEKANPITESTQNIPANPTEMFSLTEISQEEKQELASLNVGRFVPSLSICYATSKAVSDGIARPGEFLYAGKTPLGKEIEFIVLDYRYHVAYQDKKEHSLTEHFYHLRSNPVSLKQDTAYAKFCDDCPPTHKLIKGTDLFVFIVNNQSFGCFYCKSTLDKHSIDLINNSRGARSQIVATKPEEYKGNKWFSLVPSVTKRAAKGSPLTDPSIEKVINVPLDIMMEMKKKFDDPYGGVEVAQEEGFQSDR